MSAKAQPETCSRSVPSWYPASALPKPGKPLLEEARRRQERWQISGVFSGIGVSSLYVGRGASRTREEVTCITGPSTALQSRGRNSLPRADKA